MQAFTVPLLEAATALTGVAQMQHTPDQQQGYVWMFVLMASTPYILLIVIGGGIFRARRRAREREVERMLSEQREWETAHPGGRA